MAGPATVVRAQPMAGTAPRGGDPAADAAPGRRAAGLAHRTGTSTRSRSTWCYDTLLPWCSYLDYEAEPSVVAVANVQHLATLVEGRLSQPAPSVLELVGRAPPDARGERLAPRRRRRRGSTSTRASTAAATPAPVGLGRRRGNGTWAVSIRCAESTAPRPASFAGNGIVADCDPDTELAETQAKLQAILGALVRP